MLKKVICVGVLLTAFVFLAAAQSDDPPKFSLSADLTTIYTLGNMSSTESRIDAEPTTSGAYFFSQVTGTRKSGYFTAANIYANFNPLPWLEGYFKLYAVHRPGSFYMPLSMENMSTQDFAFTVDAVYGKVSLIEALGFDVPVGLYLKAGKYKYQPSQFGLLSKYKTEQVLYMMNTKTDFTYELGITWKFLTISAGTNYLLNQSVQRYFDEDGALKHFNLVLNEYVPQFMVSVKIQDLYNLDAELLYGQNLSGIHSGHSAGLSARYTVGISDSISLPIGFSFAFHQKNIDMMGQAAIATPLPWAYSYHTVSFRKSIGTGLGVGLRLKTGIVGLEANLAGTFYNIGHYYRDDLKIFKMSIDTMVTFVGNYFVGGGFVMGSLTDAVWKTRKDVEGDDDWNRTYGFKNNFGFEVYAGLNLGNSSKFVIGFNQNRGIALNHMLEARHDGQMKYKQEGTTWSTDELAEAGGIYFKFAFRF